MKAFVPIKRVPDYQVKVKVRSDGSGVETDGIKWIVNPFDEIAIEEALRLKEKGVLTEVVAVSIGPAEVATQIRYVLAMGADSGILVKTDEYVDSDLASRILGHLWKRGGDFGICIMGKQAIDSDSGQTAQLIAARLNLPQACFASKVEINESEATVTREVDGGLETIQIPLPAIISTDLRLNEPRYASLPGIMKAKKKPLEELDLNTLRLSDETLKAPAAVLVTKMSTPAGRKGGKKIDSIEALVQALQNEAKVF